jgi:hypothetical protein
VEVEGESFAKTVLIFESEHSIKRGNWENEGVVDNCAGCIKEISVFDRENYGMSGVFQKERF